MSHQRRSSANTVLLVALSVIAAGLAGAGTLLADEEQALLREVAQLAAESPLVEQDQSVQLEVGTRPPARHVTEPGVVYAGTGADFAIRRAVDFLMEQGLAEEGRRVAAALGRAEVRVGPGQAGWHGIAVPRWCAELTPEEERDADRGLPRTVALARALLAGVWAQPEDDHPAPAAAAVWTRVLETMTSWVRAATHQVESAGAGGGDGHAEAWRALVLVEAMRSALRDYRDLGWCEDGRGESWEALSANLIKTRALLKKKLESRA